MRPGAFRRWRLSPLTFWYFWRYARANGAPADRQTLRECWSLTKLLSR